MDWSELEKFLLVREAKADLTVKYMMQRFRRMRELGFDFASFAASDQAALREGDDFLLKLRKGGAKTGAVVNYQKNLKALARFHGWKGADWALLKPSRRSPQVYNLTELNRLLRLPYGRSMELRLRRALVTAHLGLGWRTGEMAKLCESHLDAANHTVNLAYPEKRNPQRLLPVHQSLLDPNRAFMSWVRNRPIAPSNPDAVWTYQDRKGRVQLMTNHRLALELSRAGKLVGVRANCQRGRSTCTTALIEQGKSLAFVRHWVGHASYQTLAEYVAYVDLGMAKHLRSPAWFLRPRGTQAAQP